MTWKLVSSSGMPFNAQTSACCMDGSASSCIQMLLAAVLVAWSSVEELCWEELRHLHSGFFARSHSSRFCQSWSFVVPLPQRQIALCTNHWTHVCIFEILCFNALPSSLNTRMSFCSQSHCACFNLAWEAYVMLYSELHFYFDRINLKFHIHCLVVT